MECDYRDEIKELLRVKYRDRKGKEITHEEWVQLISPLGKYRNVGRVVIGKYLISTVWQGIENLDGTLYETMVFDRESDKPWSDLYMHRYQTEEDALVGHQTIVAIAQKCVDNGDEFEVNE